MFRLKCGRVVSHPISELDWTIEKQLRRCEDQERQVKFKQDRCNETLDQYKKTLEEALQNDPCKWVLNERQQVTEACAGLLSEEDSMSITWEEGVLREKCGAKRDLDEYLQSPPNDACREVLFEAELATSWTLHNRSGDICKPDWLAQLRQVVQDIETACKPDLHKPRVHQEVRAKSGKAQDFLRICAPYNDARQRR